MTDNFFDLTNQTFVGIMIRFAIDIVFLFVLIRLIYFRYNRKERFLFTFFLMGIITFFICSMLRTVFVDIGMAFGIFAIFSILRMRTRNFSVKDMAYTFSTIGLSVINSLKVLKFPMLGILIIDSMIILSAFLLEEYLTKHRYESYNITYENLELLKPEKRQKLLKDVSAITGKEVMKISIRRVNYKKKEARLNISCKVNPNS
jgi:hypothetical protein